MSWIAMVVGVVGGAAVVLLYKQLAPGKRAIGVATVVVLLISVVFVLAWLGDQQQSQYVHVELPSPDQPPGVIVDGSSGVYVNPSDDGLMLYLSARPGELPMITIRTVIAVSGTTEEQHFQAAIGEIQGKFEGEFRPVPFEIAPTARGAAWHTADRRIFAWLVTRAPGVTTVFQCVTALDVNPETECDSLFSAVSLDPHFRPRVVAARLD